MITVSRKEIEALQRWQDDEEIANNCYEDDDGCFILYDDLRALLDKAEVSEPVGYKVTGKLGERCSFKSNEVKKGDIIYTTPQPSRIAELEAEIARLKAIIDDIKVIDNVFGVDSADNADLERYRWLRDKAGNDILKTLQSKITDVAFDEAIDIAMKAK